MERLLIAAPLVLLAVVVALVVQRRRPDPPTQASSWTVPKQLDRADFVDPEKPWLVALFSSANCEACAQTRDAMMPLESPQVAVMDIEVDTHPDLHQRYRIDAVPMLVMADAQGVVLASKVGPTSASDLWSVVADVRDAH
ncbi:MAG: thioredoxin family protein [Actinomycetia bacterium]|nr:thioredoxin family protein [Actinomycetes bacterium]